MQTTSILPSPLGVDSDGAAQATSALGSRVRRVGAAIWRAMEASGQARAMRELRALHGHWELGDADFARRLRDGSLFSSAPSHPLR